jgi:hypothetical protein
MVFSEKETNGPRTPVKCRDEQIHSSSDKQIALHNFNI